MLSIAENFELPSQPTQGNVRALERLSGFSRRISESPLG